MREGEGRATGNSIDLSIYLSSISGCIYYRSLTLWNCRTWLTSHGELFLLCQDPEV